MARSKHLGIAIATLLFCTVISTASGWAAASVWLLYKIFRRAVTSNH
jgi:hypothetical protein